LRVVAPGVERAQERLKATAVGMVADTWLGLGARMAHAKEIVGLTGFRLPHCPPLPSFPVRISQIPSQQLLVDDVLVCATTGKCDGLVLLSALNELIQLILPAYYFSGIAEAGARLGGFLRRWFVGKGRWDVPCDRPPAISARVSKLPNVLI